MINLAQHASYRHAVFRWDGQLRQILGCSQRPLLQACRFFNAGGQQEAIDLLFDLAPAFRDPFTPPNKGDSPLALLSEWQWAGAAPARNSLPASPHRADQSWPQQHNHVVYVTQLSLRQRSPHAPGREQVQSLSGRIRKLHARPDIRGPSTVQPVPSPLTNRYRSQPLRRSNSARIYLLVNIQPYENGPTLNSGDKPRNPCCFLHHAGNSFVRNVPASKQSNATPSSVVSSAARLADY